MNLRPGEDICQNGPISTPISGECGFDLVLYIFFLYSITMVFKYHNKNDRHIPGKKYFSFTNSSHYSDLSNKHTSMFIYFSLIFPQVWSLFEPVFDKTKIFKLLLFWLFVKSMKVFCKVWYITHFKWLVKDIWGLEMFINGDNPPTSHISYNISRRYVYLFSIICPLGTFIPLGSSIWEIGVGTDNFFLVLDN